MPKRGHRKKSRGSAGNNRKLSEQFLKSNAQKEDVISTNTGLQYQIIERGQGKCPTINSEAVVHQRCMLLGGKVIEDTYKKNQPETCAVAELIEGYKEGLLLMQKGARYRFFVPPELAWGKTGTSNKIPPNALLIFDVRLIDFRQK
jgi:FKBP-type peptidyl-prolyl cis-trans isomerase FkpA